MNPAEIKSAIDEARVLGIYAARSGTLPKESRIFELIDSMTQAIKRGGELPPAAPLFTEIAVVSRAAGVTVAQLMQRKRLRWMRLLVGSMTLLLTLYTA